MSTEDYVRRLMWHLGSDAIEQYTAEELLDRSIRRLEREPQYDWARAQWGSELRQLEALRAALPMDEEIQRYLNDAVKPPT